MSLKEKNTVSAGNPKKIALVLSNPAISTTTGWPVGFWWSDLTHPFYEFIEKGYHVELFSPFGGNCDADAMSDPNESSGYSSGDLITQGLIHTQSLKDLIVSTMAVKDLAIKNFDAIVVAGGQVPVFTFDTAVYLLEQFSLYWINQAIMQQQGRNIGSKLVRR
jgi:putative intracellular protease/amidase